MSELQDRRDRNAARMRRYRTGIRSPWGKGRPPNAQSRVVRSARKVLAAILDNSDGWSVFDEFTNEGQEAIAELVVALSDLDAAKETAPSEPADTNRAGGRR
jgi:hypothetical protein